MKTITAIPVVILATCFGTSPATALDLPAGDATIPFLVKNSTAIVLPRALGLAEFRPPYYVFTVLDCEVLQGRPQPPIRIALRVGYDESATLPTHNQLLNSVAFVSGPVTAEQLGEGNLPGNADLPLYMIYGGDQGLWKSSEPSEHFEARLSSLKSFLQAEGPDVGKWVEDMLKAPDPILQRSGAVALNDPRFGVTGTVKSELFARIMSDEQLPESTKQIAIQAASEGRSSWAANSLVDLARLSHVEKSLRISAVQGLSCYPGGEGRLAALARTGDPILKDAVASIVPEQEPVFALVEIPPTPEQLERLRGLIKSKEATESDQVANLVREISLSTEVRSIIMDSFGAMEQGLRREALSAVASHNDDSAASFLTELFSKDKDVERRKDIIVAIGKLKSSLRTWARAELNSRPDDPGAEELQRYVKAFIKP